MRKRRLKAEEDDLELLRDLGPELYQYLDGENRLLKTRREHKARFNVGDEVEINTAGWNGYGIIIYGPYNNADVEHVYEVEGEDGTILSVRDNDSLKPWVRPLPTEEVDDEF